MKYNDDVTGNYTFGIVALRTMTGNESIGIHTDETGWLNY